MRTKSHLGMLNLSAQGKYPRVLFVCTGGMLRSATASHVFASPPYNWNTRAAGTMDGAVVPVSETLLEWADKIYVMQQRHYWEIKEKFEGFMEHKMKVLDIEDIYEYRNEVLCEKLIESVNKHEAGE